MMLKYIWRGLWRDRKDGYSLGDASLSALIKMPASDSWRWPSLGLSLIWGSILIFGPGRTHAWRWPAAARASRLGSKKLMTYQEGWPQVGAPCLLPWGPRGQAGPEEGPMAARVAVGLEAAQGL